MKLAIVELHDVSPYYRVEFLSALELLEEVGLDRFSLLVVPCFWEYAPLGGDGNFLNLIKNLGAELVLHGYTHKGKKRLQDLLWTDGEGEFGGLDLTETYERVRSGLELMEYLGLKTTFFVPPAWIGNPYLEDVLYSLGFEGIAYRWYIKDLGNEKSISSPVLSFSSRNLLSWLSLKALPSMERLYKDHQVLRLALHMTDFRDERKVRLWKEILSNIEKERRLISYGELLSKSGLAPSFKGFQSTGRLVQ